MRYASEVSFSKYYTMLKGLLSTTTLKGVLSYDKKHGIY